MTFGKPSGATAPGGALAGSALSFGALGQAEIDPLMMLEEMPVHQSTPQQIGADVGKALLALALFGIAVFAGVVVSGRGGGD